MRILTKLDNKSKKKSSSIIKLLDVEKNGIWKIIATMDENGGTFAAEYVDSMINVVEIL